MGTDKNNFPYNLQLTRQIAVFASLANGSLKHMKISKTQVSKKLQSGRFLVRLFGSLMIVDLPLMKNSLTLLNKSVLVPLELTAASKADIRVRNNDIDYIKIK